MQEFAFKFTEFSFKACDMFYLAGRSSSRNSFAKPPASLLQLETKAVVFVHMDLVTRGDVIVERGSGGRMGGVRRRRGRTRQTSGARSRL